MGTKVSGPRPLKACTEGTTIRFEPDFSIFSRSLNLQDVRDTFVDLSVFQPNMVLQLNGETFWAPGGLSDLVVGLAGGPQTGLTPVFFRGEMAAVQAQLALLWKPSGQPQVMGYVRQERVEVGSHIEGFWEGLRQAFVEYEPALKGVHLPAFVEVMAPGLVAAVEVKFTDSRHRPSYYNLDDDEAAQAVCCILGQGLGQELRNNPSLRQELFARIP